MQLTATKSSLYKLVSVHEQLPRMKETKFSKTPRSRSFWLRWRNDIYFYEAYLTACAGRLMLAIEKRDYEQRLARDVYTLTIPDLRERGMIEEKNIERAESFVKQKILVAQAARGLLQTKGDEEAAQAGRGQHVHNHLSENAIVKHKKERHHPL